MRMSVKYYTFVILWLKFWLNCSLSSMVCYTGMWIIWYLSKYFKLWLGSNQRSHKTRIFQLDSWLIDSVLQTSMFVYYRILLNYSEQPGSQTPTKLWVKMMFILCWIILYNHFRTRILLFHFYSFIFNTIICFNSFFVTIIIVIST